MASLPKITIFIPDSVRREVSELRLAAYEIRDSVFEMHPHRYEEAARIVDIAIRKASE